jgi:glutathione synthase
MNKKLGVVMDPIQHIEISHDGSFAMLLAAQAVGYELYYIEPHDLYILNGEAHAFTSKLNVTDDRQHWFDLTDKKTLALAELDVILMRKDPPFTIDYVYLTYILELAERAGTKVVNSPAALRDANEKAFITWFPQCIAPTLMSSKMLLIRDFIAEQREVILKPLDGMGGHSIFYVTPNEKNLSVILENMTQHGKRMIMAQRYLPEIVDGDKRIILINGEPIPNALKRVPPKGELRGNLAAGGSGHCVPLSDRDHWLCQQIAPTLRQKGLFLVGLDVIGDYITEINVTSPTCMREITQATGIDVAGLIIEKLEH